MLVLGLALALAAPATQAQTPPAPADPVAVGKVLVERNCGGCHATGREGDSPLPQAPRFRDLHERFAVEDLAEAFAEGVIVGHGPMPEWRFEPDDVEALVAYLKSLETQTSTGH